MELSGKDVRGKPVGDGGAGRKTEGTVSKVAACVGFVIVVDFILF